MLVGERKTTKMLRMNSPGEINAVAKKDEVFPNLLRNGLPL
jgi:hypothetical protein